MTEKELEDMIYHIRVQSENDLESLIEYLRRTITVEPSL